MDNKIENNNICILQPNYLPWLGYFDLLYRSDFFIIYDDVQFDRGGWRNRNRLLNSDGKPLWVTVPVFKKGRSKQLCRDVQCLSSNWPQKHLKTIHQLYCKAPYFDMVFSELEAFLMGRQHLWLLDLCIESLQIVLKILDIEVKLKLSSEVGFEGAKRTERLVEICKFFRGARYISPDAGKKYMDEDLFKEAGIQLLYQNYQHPTYDQFHHPFVSHLSIIDALMFKGPSIREFIGVSEKQDESLPLLTK